MKNTSFDNKAPILEVKNLKKSEGKSEEHKTTEFIQNEEHMGGNYGKLYGNTW